MRDRSTYFTAPGLGKRRDALHASGSNESTQMAAFCQQPASSSYSGRPGSLFEVLSGSERMCPQDSVMYGGMGKTLSGCYYLLRRSHG